MIASRLDGVLPEDCRRYRAAGAAWDRAPGAAIEAHALACDACREHDDDVLRARAGLTAFAAEPVPDLWPAVRARLPRAREAAGAVWLVRAAAALVGMAAAYGALCALARRNAPAAPAHAAFAALREPCPEQERVAAVPEMQLLIALAEPVEERR